MTTKVIIQAHCGTDTRVEIETKEFDEIIDFHELADGEKLALDVYDDKAITVKEVKG